MLLVACSAVTTASAQQRLKPTIVSNPNNVIKAFEFLIDLYGQKAGQTYSVEKNPNTGIIESSERIVAFTCKKSEPYIEMIGDDFMKDEPKSYQIKHITPGQGSQNFTLAVHTNNPNEVNHYAIRTKPDQEMWFMACKNPENPSLRDAYAIVWQPAADNKVKGTIYMITSPRPSNFGKAFESADSKKNDDTIVLDTVIMMPSDNKNFVPVESYADQPKVSQPQYVAPEPRSSSNWEPSPEIKMQLEGKAMAIKAQIDAIKATYQSMKPFFDARNMAGTDKIFAQITKQNNALNDKFQDFVKTLKNIETPPSEYANRSETIGTTYKEILKFYTEQNQGFTEILKEFGTLPKGAQKAQKELNKLIEKNMKEMSKAIAGF